jgi:hypothetical protein
LVRPGSRQCAGKRTAALRGNSLADLSLPFAGAVGRLGVDGLQRELRLLADRKKRGVPGASRVSRISGTDSMQVGRVWWASGEDVKGGLHNSPAVVHSCAKRGKSGESEGREGGLSGVFTAPP